MKVLHVIPSLSRSHGGPTTALALMERALTAQGVTVETATTDDDGPGRRNGRPCSQPLRENGVVHWYFSKLADFYKPSPQFARWIASKAADYDLIHIHALFSFTSAAAAWAAHRAGVPYVVRPLGTLNAYGMRERRPWLKKLAMRLVDGVILRRAAAVHFTSAEEAAEAAELGIPMNVAVVPLGVETHDCRSPEGDCIEPESERRLETCVLFLSRLDAKKNLEGLLDAIAILKPEIPGLLLLVAGAGAPDYVASLKARAARAGVADCVVWAGHIEASAKAAAFARADVFVLPSFSENFGIAAAEALAQGLPCVLGHGVALAKDVAAAHAGVSVMTDPESIAQGLRLIIASKAGLTLMSANARQLALERFSAQAMGANLKRLYTGILNGSEGFHAAR
jgi:glycosyltransferase involved in cell wall biosynthesis